MIFAEVGDRWVALQPEDATDFADLCDLDRLLEGDDQEATLTKLGTDTVEGQEVVKVRSVDPAGTSTVGYVSVEEPHYLLKLDGGDEGTFTFSEFRRALLHRGASGRGGLRPRQPGRLRVVAPSRGVAAATALVLAGSLAGCGDGPTPGAAGDGIDTAWFGATSATDVLAAAAEASTSAESFRLDRVEVLAEGRATSSLALTAGGSCAGTLRLPTWGQAADVVVSDGMGVARGSRLFWFLYRGPDAPAPLRRIRFADRYGDRWARLGGLAARCKAAKVLRPVVKASRADDPVKDGLGDVDGVPAGRVVTLRGKATVTIWVALAPPHQALRVTEVRTAAPTSLTVPGDSDTRFSGYGDPVEVDVPAPADTESFPPS